MNLQRKESQKKLEITERTTEEEYLKLLEQELPLSIEEFNPEFILYNAGTDCLDGDPLGNLNLSPEAIASRDEIVFQHALSRDIPIIMVLSGGYQLNNANVISVSIERLVNKFDLKNYRRGKNNNNNNISSDDE